MKVLVADQDRELVNLLLYTLANDGFTVLPAFDGEVAARLFQVEHPDLILLDLMLPKRSGLDVLMEMRRLGNVPIIVFVQTDLEDQALEALQLGADDYVTKPLRPREVRARALALLRRCNEWSRDPSTTPRHLALGTVELNPRTRQVQVNGHSVRLSRTEFALLEFLMQNHDVVIQPPQLAANVWGYGDGDGNRNDNVVKVAISRLRHKIEPDPAYPRYIVNVPGVGYMFRHETRTAETVEETAM